MNAKIDIIEKPIVGTSPHVHAPGNIQTIMRDVVIALIPSVLAGWRFFGFRAIVITLTCTLTCVLSEYLARRAMKRKNTIFDLSAVVTGILLALNLPSTIPLWMAILGSVFAIIVAKQLFGGLGYNPFNPALIARAFLLISFTGAMTTWTESTWLGTVTTATPLGYVKEALKAGNPAPSVTNQELWRFFIGDMNGCLGETSAIAIILGGLYLLVRRVITWHIPLSYIGTVAIYAAVLRFVSPDASMPVLFHLLTGGLLLGAFFMATDMVTTPTTHSGQIVFGIGCGLLTMIIRTVNSGAYPEGVSFSILIMNAFTPLISRACRHTPFGRGKKVSKCAK